MKTSRIQSSTVEHFPCEVNSTLARELFLNSTVDLMSADAQARLRQYRPISQIGAGGFGTVSKAWNRVTGAVVAIKRIRLTSGSCELPDEIPVSMRSEIDVLTEFGRPASHILPLLDHIYDPSKRSLYLIFKYYAYDLRALTMAGCVPLSRAVLYVHGIIQALRTLHSAGYAHRDVKPENVFVAVDHEVALGDFGLAQKVRPPMASGSGTLHYRAPEQLLGDSAYGTAVDMWALGCVMHFLVFGAVPFEGKSDPDQFHMICRRLGSPSTRDWPAVTALPNAVLYLPRRPITSENFRTELLAGVDGKDLAKQAYIDLMLQMLQWNPDKRITAERALAHPLFSKGVRVEGPIVIKELHQKERVARPFCDFLLNGFEKDLEFPRLVPPSEI